MIFPPTTGFGIRREIRRLNKGEEREKDEEVCSPYSCLSFRVSVVVINC